MLVYVHSFHVFCSTDTHVAGLLSLYLWRRRVIISIVGRLYQLAHLRHRGQLSLVWERRSVESEEWVLLVSLHVPGVWKVLIVLNQLLQCVLACRHSS